MKWDTTSLGLPLFPSFVAQWVPSLARWVASLTFAQILALVTFPVCFGKNVINIVQGWKASKILVGVDLAERTKARMTKLQEKH
jgi:CDP-diacylglycerol--inositol 3-phosphatidyltransferase